MTDLYCVLVYGGYTGLHSVPACVQEVTNLEYLFAVSCGTF